MLCATAERNPYKHSEKGGSSSTQYVALFNVKCGLKVVQVNLFTEQKQSHRCRKQTYSYQRGKAGRDKLGGRD